MTTARIGNRDGGLLVNAALLRPLDGTLRAGSRARWLVTGETVTVHSLESQQLDLWGSTPDTLNATPIRAPQY